MLIDDLMQIVQPKAQISLKQVQIIHGKLLCHFSQWAKPVKLLLGVILHVLRKLLEGSLKCKTCGTEFLTKPQLMTHRKLEHPNTVAPCKNYLVGQCDYEFCWWMHKERGAEQMYGF